MKKQIIHVIAILALHFSGFSQISGTLNKNFSSNGWNSGILGSQNGLFINKTLVQLDGKIVACTREYLQNNEKQVVIAIYNSDGSVDRTFGGGDGLVLSKEDRQINLNTSANEMAFQNKGKIIIAGNTTTGNGRILRLNTDGSLDKSFGTADVGDLIETKSIEVQLVSVQSDNKFIVCGKERQLVNDNLETFVFLKRFTENSMIDRSFGNLGSVVYNSKTWTGNADVVLAINELIVLTDTSILVNQTFTVQENSAVLLRKFKPKATLDAAFGTNGEVLKTGIFKESVYRSSISAALEDGFIITSFTSQNKNATCTASIYRKNVQSEIDPSFNINLENSTNLPESLQLKVSADKVYIIKKSNKSGCCFDMILCNDLSGNGVTSFGNKGVSLLNQNNIPQSYPSKAAVSSDGTIYLVSNSSDPNNSPNTVFLAVNVMEFNPNLSHNDILATHKIIIFPIQQLA
jgi:uncharacterized delta-60 repeat protein